MWCFLFEELKRIFGIAMGVALGLGDRGIRMDGLPIGGLVSKVAASAVLSQQEREWTEDEEKRSRVWYHKDGYRWSSLAYCKRYVDDVMVVSSMWCASFLAEVVLHVYTVQYDVEPPNAELA